MLDNGLDKKSKLIFYLKQISTPSHPKSARKEYEAKIKLNDNGNENITSNVILIPTTNNYGIGTDSFIIGKLDLERKTVTQFNK